MGAFIYSRVLLAMQIMEIRRQIICMAILASDWSVRVVRVVRHELNYLPRDEKQ